MYNLLLSTYDRFGRLKVIYEDPTYIPPVPEGSKVPLFLVPEYHGLIVEDSASDNDVDVSLENTELSANNQNYKIEGSPGVAGIQSCVFYIRCRIPDTFEDWETSAIVVKFATSSMMAGDCFIDLHVGKVGAGSYAHSDTDLVSVSAGTWDNIVVSESDITGVFATGDILELKLVCHADAS